MGYFPFFMDIEGQSGLIVGGGAVALRKVFKLLPFHPRLTVVAPVIDTACDSVIGSAADRELPGHSEIAFLQRPFREEDLEGKAFVIAASDEKDVNREVGRLCREKNIPVNVADDKEACSFLFPALIRRGRLTVGISTEGASPAAAGWIRGAIEAALPEGIAKNLEELADLREQTRERIPQQKERAQILRQAAFDCMDGGRFDGEEKAGSITLVGAGCGAYDLITVRGMQAVQRAQVLIYDDLIDERLLSFAGEGCEKIYVGKRRGMHSMEQERINELLISKAREGKNVIRLKGGDPFVFGRGGEEILALRGAGIHVEEIPGISSAVGVPAAAGIPVTHRGSSRSVHIITGHGHQGEDGLPENMEALAALDGTLVFLMGLGKIEKITEHLRKSGKPPETPAAVIRGGFDGDPQIVRGCLWEIADKARRAGISAPAVIVVGQTAGMDLFL